MKRIKTVFLIVAAVAAVCGGAGTASAEEGLLGRVAIERSMLQSGGATVDELVITAGRHKGANLIVDRGNADAMALYLGKGGRDGFVSLLRKLVEWGETARKENIDTIKPVGTVSCQLEYGHGSAVIATRFISSKGGASWLGQIRFCQLPPAVEKPAEETGVKTCERDRYFYLRPAETERLIEILGEKTSSPAK